MAIEITCTCGRILNAPDSAIGKKGRCKGCGKVIDIVTPPEPEKQNRVPDLGIQMEDEDVPVDPRLAPPPPPSVKIPPEPFYYGFLVFYAYTCITLGIVQFVVFLGLAVVAAQYADYGQSVVLGSTVLWSLGVMLGVVLVSCPVLLAVDAARNVRAMRYGIK